MDLALISSFYREQKNSARRERRLAKTLSFAAAKAAMIIVTRQNCVVARISGGF